MIPSHSALLRSKKADLVALVEALRVERAAMSSSARQADLELMRSDLLAAMRAVEPGDLPRVCRELRAVDAELADLPTARSPEQELVDDLKARRAHRRSVS